MSRNEDRADIAKFAAEPGRRWRAQGRDGDEVCKTPGEGIFDELVVDHWLHVEAMSDRIWWLRVGDAEILVSIEADGGVTVDVTRGTYSEPRGTTKLYVPPQPGSGG